MHGKLFYYRKKIPRDFLFTTECIKNPSTVEMKTRKKGIIYGQELRRMMMLFNYKYETGRRDTDWCYESSVIETIFQCSFWLPKSFGVR